MKIIKDIDKQLSLKPQVIYLLLSAEEIKAKSDLLGYLNVDIDYTLGLFEFQMIEKEDFYSSVSLELANSAKQMNTIVRLIGDDSDWSNYAVDNISFSVSNDVIKKSLQKFVVGICKENLNQMSSINSIEAEEFTSLKLFFIEALTYSKENISNSRFLKGDICPSAMPSGFEKMVMEAQMTGDIQKLWDWTEQHITRKKPEKKPEISVEIKLFPKEITKGRKSIVEKTEKNYQMLYGVIFKVNGVEYPIHLDTDESMLYICTLLRIKMGEKLYIHEFRNNKKGKDCKFQKESSKNWFEKAYELIFPLGERTDDFKNWIKKVETSHRPLSQAKSNAAVKIENLLPIDSGAEYFCKIETEIKPLESYFYVLLEPDEIIVPKEMQFLLDGVNCFNKVKE